MPICPWTWSQSRKISIFMSKYTQKWTLNIQCPGSIKSLCCSVLLTRDFCSKKQQNWWKYNIQLTVQNVMMMYVFHVLFCMIISLKKYWPCLNHLPILLSYYSESHRALAVFWGTWVRRGWEFRLRWGEGLEDRDRPVQDGHRHCPLQEKWSCLCRR